MILFLGFCIIIYLVSFVFSPFPYWKTYVILWRTLLFYKNPAITREARIKQAKFLMGYSVFCPLWTLLWYLDELFYPGYKNKTVRPVFIMGQPRSGTTFLHRTLAADTENFVAVRHIEWRYPYITLQKFFNNCGWATKILQKNYWPDSSVGRMASKMHPDRLVDWEEDGIFFEECFLHHFFIFLRFPYPHLLTYLDDFPALPQHVQNKMVQTHQKVIQKVLFMRGSDHSFYLSKEVTSHNKFMKFLKLYQDAKFILSVRRSEDFMNSLFSLVRFSTNAKNGIDPAHIPGWERVFVQRMQKDSLFLRNLCTHEISRENQVRILFDCFIKDVPASIEYIYDCLDLSISDSYRKHLLKIDNDQEKRERGYDYERNPYQGFDDFDDFVRMIDVEFRQMMNLDQDAM